MLGNGREGRVDRTFGPRGGGGARSLGKSPEGHPLHLVISFVLGLELDSGLFSINNNFQNNKVVSITRFETLSYIL